VSLLSRSLRKCSQNLDKLDTRARERGTSAAKKFSQWPIFATIKDQRVKKFSSWSWLARRSHQLRQLLLGRLLRLGPCRKLHMHRRIDLPAVVLRAKLGVHRLDPFRRHQRSDLLVDLEQRQTPEPGDVAGEAGSGKPLDPAGQDPRGDLL